MFSFFKKTKSIEHCSTGVEDGIIWASEAGEMACTKAYLDIFLVQFDISNRIDTVEKPLSG